MDHYRGITAEGAIVLREYFHAEGNRFGMMKRCHEEQASFALGAEHAIHLLTAARWKTAQSICYQHASEISMRAGIPEYGEAWEQHLQPHEVAHDR